MEIIIIGGVLLVALWWFFLREKPVESVTTAPYKVDTPPTSESVPENEPAKCGCGRSLTGYCVGLHKLSDADWAVHADNPSKVVVVEQAVAPVEVKASPAKPRAKRPAAPAKAAPAKAAPAKAAPAKARTARKTSKK
jgi:hypothetical protein